MIKKDLFKLSLRLQSRGMVEEAQTAFGIMQRLGADPFASAIMDLYRVVQSMAMYDSAAKDIHMTFTEKMLNAKTKKEYKSAVRELASEIEKLPDSEYKSKIMELIKKIKS